MGLYRSDQIVFGWHFGPDTVQAKNMNRLYVDDKLLPYIEGHEGVEYVLDRSRDGTFSFGYDIAHADEDGWEYVALDKTLPDTETVKAKFKDAFGFLPIDEPKLFIFTDWS